LSRSKLQVHLEGIGDGTFLFNVHADGDKPPDVKPGFYEVKIIGEGISNSWVCLWGISSGIWVKSPSVGISLDVPGP
jgi:hypothetical protein